MRKPPARRAWKESSIDPPVDQPASPFAELEFHPAAAMFPLLPADGPNPASSWPSEHGLLQPIVLHEGRILDGRDRHRARQHAGPNSTG